MRRWLFCASILALVGAPSLGLSAGGFSPYVDDQGKITRPTGYWDKWAYLGSWVVPDENAKGHGFHDVFTQPESLRAFKETGQWPDGAVLVKEIRKVQSAAMTTGKASWAGEPLVWFVMIKDTQGRFPGNPNWGNGWGWGLFNVMDPSRNASANYEKDCLPCHVPAKSTDWVYLQAYPELRP
jgi:hypothetical protein